MSLYENVRYIAERAMVVCCVWRVQLIYYFGRVRVASIRIDGLCFVVLLDAVLCGKWFC